MNLDIITKNTNILADVSTLTNADWLSLRKKGCGGSEVAGIFGKSNYASPLSIYMDKMSDEIQELDNDYIFWGKTLEPIIREKFPAKFKKATGIDIFVEEFPFMMQSKSDPFMLANIDGLVELQQDYKFSLPVGDGQWEEYFISAGLTGIMEIKTGSGFTAKNWKDNSLPDNYFLQTQSYMAVTGLSYAFVVALIDKTLLWRYVPRDEEIIAIIKARVNQFWTENVLAKIPPAPIGSDVDTDVLKGLYPIGDAESSINLDELIEKNPENKVEYCKIAESRFQYKSLAEEKKNIESEMAAHKQNIMAFMGNKEYLFTGGKKVSWKMQAGSTYQVVRQPQRVMRIG